MIGRLIPDRSMRSAISTLFVLSVLGFFMIMYRVIRLDSIKYAFLIWNLFLAWIPLSISMILSYLDNGGGENNKSLVFKFIMGFVWLFFFPNAPYMITDVIHLRGLNFITYNEYVFRFNQELMVWYDFVVVLFIIIVGCLVGFISLYLIQKIVEKQYKKTGGWILVCIVSYLSGFAIYLGRFPRLNSWEIVSNPKNVLSNIIASLGMQTLMFSMLFGSFLLLIYWGLYRLTYLKTSEN